MTPSAAYLKFRQSRQSHWNCLAASFNHSGLKSGYHNRLAEIYRSIIPQGHSILEVGCGRGDLLAALEPSHGVGVDFSTAMVAHARAAHPDLHFIHADAHDLVDINETFDYVIFSDLIDDLWDVQAFLQQIRRLCLPSTRIVFNFYSHLWSLPLRLAQALGVATPMLPQNWLTVEDMMGLLQLTGFDLVSNRPEVLLPVDIPLIAPACNRILGKLPPINLLDLTHIMVARPLPQENETISLPLVSVVIPVCNEAGNIAGLLRRIPQMGAGTEVIFVEGGSSDNSFAVIESEIAANPGLDCHILKQQGKGKGDAVRLGFSAASGDILMILDADLTVAPEDLPKFYDALHKGRGEFINGVRLVYPMHDKAMRFWNLIGNKFFSLVFTSLLGQPVKDTLCGTKALWRNSYKQIAAQRANFGDFDPFGDFDLLFGAARLNLKIIDLPVRYGERTYGSTNIKRWVHGCLLFRMVVVAAIKLKFV